MADSIENIEIARPNGINAIPNASNPIEAINKSGDIIANGIAIAVNASNAATIGRIAGITPTN